MLLPARNRKDLEDIPEEARDRLRFVWLETVDDALQAALAPEGKGAPEGGNGDCSPEATATEKPAGPK